MEGIIFDGKFLFDIIVEVKGKGVILGLGFHKCHRQMGSFKPSPPLLKGETHNLDSSKP